MRLFSQGGASMTSNTTTTVSSVRELQQALADEQAGEIVVAGRLEGVPPVRLPPGRNLRGTDGNAALVFAERTDGVQLTSDNRLASLRLETSPTNRAILNDTGVDGLGT